MRQKSIICSLLLIISVLIISLFIWTAGAVGNTENEVKKTCSVIDDTEEIIEETDIIGESVVEDNEISLDGSDFLVDNDDITVDNAGISIDDSNTSVENSTYPFDMLDISEDMNDTIDDTVNLSESTIEDSTIEDNTIEDNTIEENTIEENTTDSTDKKTEESNSSIDDNENIDGVENSTGGTNNTIDGAGGAIDEVNNSIDNIVSPENDTVSPENDTVSPEDDTVSPEDDTVSPEDDTVSPEDDTVNQADEIVNQEDDTVTPGNDTVTSGDDTVNLDDDTVSSGDDIINSDDDTVNPGDDTVNPEDDAVSPEDEDINEDDNKSPKLTVDEPFTDFVCTRTVLFNFSAVDKLDDNLTYTLYINGAERSKGVITEGELKHVEINLDDGYYTWEIKIEDSLGNTDSSGPTELNVDTKVPILTLISPEDLLVNTGGPLNFSFTAGNELDDLYKDQDLTYEVDVDGEPIEGKGSGTMHPGECIQTQDITNLSDGAHDWSVYIEDKAGNNITSESRTFYVDKKGLRVSLISPNNEHLVNPTFKFRVSGGTGLPFNYILLVDEEEVKRSTCDGSENNTLEVGEDSANDYSIEASIPDGEDKTWTVNITDIAGNNYIPEPYRFSLDTADPGRVANLSVRDAPGETQWSYTLDSPGLYVSWDANAGGDLASTPYDVFISDSEPHSIGGMKKIRSMSDTSLRIEKYDVEPLVYGKDYWVAVIARDKFGNYNKCFVSICGPVRTYEDMNIKLNPGWNMKSVPKRLLESNSAPESVFGKNSIVLYWNGKSWEVPKTIEPCKGYWVYSPEAFENNIKFMPMPSDTESDNLTESFDLAPGWQMIGPTSVQPVEWSTTLASLENSHIDYKFSNLITYSQNEGWNGIIPGLELMYLTNGGESVTSNGNLTNDSVPTPVGMLQYEGKMVPGQGYWIYMSKAGTYNPSESDGTSEDVPIDDSIADNMPIDEENTDNATADDLGVDNETVEDIVVDEGSTDDGTSDDETTDTGTVEDVGVDDVGVDEESTDDETTDLETGDDGTADNIPISD